MRPGQSFPYSSVEKNTLPTEYHQGYHPTFGFKRYIIPTMNSINMNIQQKEDIEMPYDDTRTAELHRGIQHDETLPSSGLCEGVKDSNRLIHHQDDIQLKEIKKSCVSKLKKPVVKSNTTTRGSNLRQRLAETLGLTGDTIQCIKTETIENPNDSSVSMLKGAISCKQPDTTAPGKLSEQKTHTCNVCQLIFVDLDSLKTHKTIHTAESDDCDANSFAYSGNNSLGFISVGEKLYKCVLCDLDAATCSHRTQLGEKLYQYDVCDDVSEVRTKAKRKPYKCEVCGIAFVANCYLIRHNRIHTGEKPYKCDVCGRDFRESAQMKRHKRTHTGEKPFKCDICGAGFIASYYLTRHRRKHTGEKPYKCDICALDFNSNDCLKRHRRIHTGEKPYKCDFCGLFFRERGQMKTHKRIHTGEKPFRCEVCDLGFTQSGHLIRHKRTHTGDKPYKCDMCEQVFIQSDCLKRHKRVHAGEKPYSCDICGLDFTERVSLKRHKKTHTVEKSIHSDICDLHHS